ncbi:hypothetical protein HK100_006240 [Physocladia obscura]|uniref:Uncharacterized protein n=1 Tax=Physocladia obscura TaxID=109957 RepID=A0AAD5T5W8_9FUNG|nr:hypothetical protein HK100_006240 [Physocladia obscura]
MPSLGRAKLFKITLELSLCIFQPFRTGNDLMKRNVSEIDSHFGKVLFHSIGMESSKARGALNPLFGRLAVLKSLEVAPWHLPNQTANHHENLFHVEDHNTLRESLALTRREVKVLYHNVENLVSYVLNFEDVVNGEIKHLVKTFFILKNNCIVRCTLSMRLTCVNADHFRGILDVTALYYEGQITVPNRDVFAAQYVLEDLELDQLEDDVSASDSD